VDCWHSTTHPWKVRWSSTSNLSSPLIYRHGIWGQSNTHGLQKTRGSRRSSHGCSPSTSAHLLGNICLCVHISGFTSYSLHIVIIRAELAIIQYMRGKFSLESRLRKRFSRARLISSITHNHATPGKPTNTEPRSKTSSNDIKPTLDS
jgi:hypothetical protein